MPDRPLSERLADAMAAGVGNSKLFNLIDEARELARRVEQAPTTVARDHEGAMPGDMIYVGKRLPLSWIGKRVALVEVAE